VGLAARTPLKYKSVGLKLGNGVANKFKIGDIVQLNSGGPEMTVKTILDSAGGNYRCQWFAGKKLESGDFPLASLKPVSDAE